MQKCLCIESEKMPQIIVNISYVDFPMDIVFWKLMEQTKHLKVQYYFHFIDHESGYLYCHIYFLICWWYLFLSLYTELMKSKVTQLHSIYVFSGMDETRSQKNSCLACMGYKVKSLIRSALYNHVLVKNRVYYMWQNEQTYRIEVEYNCIIMVGRKQIF